MADVQAVIRRLGALKAIRQPLDQPCSSGWRIASITRSLSAATA